MRWVLVTLCAAALTGCGASNVVQLGPGRYRVTADTEMSQSSAETAVVHAAQEFCGRQGKQADARITDARAHTAYRHYAGASAEFSCL